MVSWLHLIGLGAPCHRCGVKVSHRPDLFRIDERQCCAECFAWLRDVEDRRLAEERARSKVKYAAVRGR